MGLKQLDNGEIYQNTQELEEIKYDCKKNELIEYESIVLNELSFELNNHPSFFDIVEIF